jgi:hypothetical protein
MKIKPDAGVTQLFANAGYTCAQLYEPARGTIKARCPQGHISTYSPANFLQGERCKKCALAAKKAKPDYKPKAKPKKPKTKPKAKSRERSIKQWARKVIAVAGYICQCCKVSGRTDLEAHHLWSYADNPEQRHKLSNGMCMCKPCHTDFHRKYGYGINTPSQMDEFLS